MGKYKNTIHLPPHPKTMLMMITYNTARLLLSFNIVLAFGGE